jgi:hypothetical protein
LEKPGGWDHLEDLNVDGIVVLKFQKDFQEILWWGGGGHVMDCCHKDRDK